MFFGNYLPKFILEITLSYKSDIPGIVAYNDEILNAKTNFVIYNECWV
jgi:hypothetical protein